MDTPEFTHHAIGRALDMALDPAEIKRALTEPDRIDETPWLGAGMSRWVSGRIALGIKACDDGISRVLTVLWSSDEAWKQDAAIAPLGEGRRLRRNMRDRSA